jgi:hypothetical protein
VRDCPMINNRNRTEMYRRHTSYRPVVECCTKCHSRPPVLHKVQHSPNLGAWGCLFVRVVCLFSPSAGVALPLFVGRRRQTRSNHKPKLRRRPTKSGSP